MASLLSLPDELLCEVLGYLEPEDDLTPETTGVKDGQWTIEHSGRALAAVAKTCKRLNPVATQLLYSRYEATYDDPVLGQIDRIRLDPVARKYLRHVRIFGRHPRSKAPKATYEPSRQRLKQLKAELAHFNPFKYAQDHLNGNPVNASLKEPALLELTAIVMQAENLETYETLYMSQSHLRSRVHKPGTLLTPIINTAVRLRDELDVSNAYSRLKHLDIDLEDTQNAFILLLLRLPALKSICIRNVRILQDRYTPEYQVWPGGMTSTSGVTSIVLHCSNLHDCDPVLEMIECCKELTQFRCISDRGSDGPESTRTIYQEILRALQQHSNTLKHLELYPGYSTEGYHFGKIFRRLDGFDEFSVLDDLSVPLPFLMGRPRGIFRDGTWRSEEKESAHYPLLEDILPPEVTKLHLIMGPRISPEQGKSYLNMLSGILDTKVKHLHVTWGPMAWQNDLPINFWHIKRYLMQNGRDFTYRIKTSINRGYGKCSPKFYNGQY